MADFPEVLTNVQDGVTEIVAKHINNLETKVGIDNSANVNSLDYKVNNHASRHRSGGSDAIKLDDLSAPDDNTDLDALTTKHGLMPKTDKVKFDGISANSVRAYRSESGQSINAATYTKVQLNGEAFDPGNCFDAVTNFRYTVPEGQGGKYLACAAMLVQTSVDQAFYDIIFYVNGAASGPISRIHASGTASIAPVITEIFNLNAGDYVELWVYGSQAFTLWYGYTFMSIMRIG